MAASVRAIEDLFKPVSCRCVRNVRMRRWSMVFQFGVRPRNVTNFVRSLRYAVVVCAEKLRSLSRERRNRSASARNADRFVAFSTMHSFLRDRTLLCAWMPGTEDLFQLLGGDVRINLRSRDICMSQDRLDRAQVRAVTDHVRSATMTQAVR